MGSRVCRVAFRLGYRIQDSGQISNTRFAVMPPLHPVPTLHLHPKIQGQDTLGRLEAT